MDERLRAEIEAEAAAEAARAESEPEPTPEELARLRSLLAPHIDRPTTTRPPSQ